MDLKVNLGRYLKFRPTVIVDQRRTIVTGAPEVRKAYCFSCNDLREIGLQLPACCDSCHDEFDSGHADYVEINSQYGDYIHACCTVAAWVKENMDNDEWYRLKRARDYKENR